MKKNRVNYEKEINQIVAQGASRHALFALVRDMVGAFGPDGGVLAFSVLNDTLDDNLSADAEDVVYDVLDALSGQCHRDCWIGSGNYHLPPQAA